LFACACCRSIWRLIDDQRSRNAIEVAELYADSLVSANDLLQAAEAAQATNYPPVRPGNAGINAREAAYVSTFATSTLQAFLIVPPGTFPIYCGYSAEAFTNPESFACMAAINVAHAVVAERESFHHYDEHAVNPMMDEEYSLQAQLVRDLLGNPFQ